jgi:hypothetical protein
VLHFNSGEAADAAEINAVMSAVHDLATTAS